MSHHFKAIAVFGSGYTIEREYFVGKRGGYPNYKDAFDDILTYAIFLVRRLLLEAPFMDDDRSRLKSITFEVVMDSQS